jgi:hypothetical protein
LAYHQPKPSGRDSDAKANATHDKKESSLALDLPEKKDGRKRASMKRKDSDDHLLDKSAKKPTSA